MHRVKTPCYDSYYGGATRELKIYRGPVYNQPGAGIFGDMFRRIILPYVGKQLYTTGQDVMQEIKQGAPIRTALKRGVKRTLQRGKE